MNSGKIDILRPFGPSIAKLEIPGNIIKSLNEYTDIMNNLKLSNPKMMDIAVPANIKGLNLKEFSKSIK